MYSANGDKILGIDVGQCALYRAGLTTALITKLQLATRYPEISGIGTWKAYLLLRPVLQPVLRDEALTRVSYDTRTYAGAGYLRNYNTEGTLR